MALTSGDDKCLQLWDLTTSPPKVIVRLSGHAEQVVGYCAMREPDLTGCWKAFSVSQDQSLRVWDLSTGDEFLSARQPVWLPSEDDGATKRVHIDMVCEPAGFADGILPVRIGGVVFDCSEAYTSTPLRVCLSDFQERLQRSLKIA